MTERKNLSDNIIFEGSKDRDYQVFHIDGVYGGLDPEKGSLVFFVDIPKVQVNNDGSMDSDTIERQFLFEVRMTPAIFIGMAKWMKENADYYIKWIEEQKKKKQSSQ